MQNNENILERELSYRIYGLFLKVAREYGFCCRENVYQLSLEELLKQESIVFESKPLIPIFSKISKKKIGSFIPDLVIEHKIIVEIKAQKTINLAHVQQVLKYLEFSDYEIGYLVNFGTPRIQIIRKIYSNSRKSK